MVTTIQVNESTIQCLKLIKERTSSASYDETIVKLIKNQSTKSMAGALAEGKKYSKEEILKDLRDKIDRV